MSTSTNVFTFKNRHSPVEYTPVELAGPLGPNDILVQTSHIALNPVDVKFKNLAYWDSVWKAGMEFSGTVTQAGAEAVLKFSPGDKVCGFKLVGYGNPAIIGSLSRINILNNAVMKQPSNLDDAHAAGLSVAFGSAWCMIAASKVEQDSSVLVLGGGSAVGKAIIQLLKKHFKVKRVVATCSSRSAESVRASGADEIVDYTAQDFVNKLKRSASNEKYFNIYDPVGGNTALSIFADLLLPMPRGSTYVSLGGHGEPDAKYSDFSILSALGDMIRGQFRSLFGSWYGLRYKLVMLTVEGNWPDIVQDIIVKNDIKVEVGEVIPAAEIQKAWIRVDNGSRGKTVLKV